MFVVTKKFTIFNFRNLRLKETARRKYDMSAIFFSLFVLHMDKIWVTLEIREKTRVDYYTQCLLFYPLAAQIKTYLHNAV